nr:MAG TPA: hypothetical protein [Caudoviricetes sp.]
MISFIFLIYIPPGTSATDFYVEPAVLYSMFSCIFVSPFL